MTVRVLAVAQDPGMLRTIERAISMDGAQLVTAMDIAEAIATASSEQPDMAFVDVSLEAKAALALIHHLPAVCAGLSVYALASSADAELGSQALALGAAGLLVAPPTGDALLRAVGEVRARHARTEADARLHASLEEAEGRAGLLGDVAKLLQLAASGQREQAATAMAHALAEATGARGAAIYALRGKTTREWAQLAAIGTALGPNVAVGEERAGRQIVPLPLGERIVGHAVLDEPRRTLDLGPLAEVVAAALAMIEAPGGDLEAAPPRVYSLGYFEDLATREIDKAKRHGRRLAVAVILPSGDSSSWADKVEDAILDGVRESDVLARGRGDELLLLLPETGALGAHACRRRVTPHAEGPEILIGVSTYPHDGKTLGRLVDRARRRAKEVSRSPVVALNLASKSLAEIVDTLLACPMLDAGQGSPFPLDLSLPAAVSLVSCACREALRGGGATILVSGQSNTGLASAVVPTVGAGRPSVVVHQVDLGGTAGCGDAEAVVVVAEHGSWAFCGRHDGARFKGVHCADPIVADLIAQRLAQAAGVRLG